ncbi:hypothetical protein CR513_04761, partial [Mucuna pruriens]
MILQEKSRYHSLHKNYDSHFIIVQIHVDDIIFCEFEISMMGELKFFMRLQIKQIYYIYIHQTKYVKELLRKFKLEDCKTMSTPMHPTSVLGLKDANKKRVLGLKDANKKIDQTMYYNLGLSFKKSEVQRRNKKRKTSMKNVTSLKPTWFLRPMKDKASLHLLQKLNTYLWLDVVLIFYESFAS